MNSRTSICIRSIDNPTPRLSIAYSSGSQLPSMSDKMLINCSTADKAHYCAFCAISLSIILLIDPLNESPQAPAALFGVLLGCFELCHVTVRPVVGVFVGKALFYDVEIEVSAVNHLVAKPLLIYSFHAPVGTNDRSWSCTFAIDSWDSQPKTFDILQFHLLY